MKIYTAARYSRQEEMRLFGEELRRLGHTPTARWTHGDEEGKTQLAAAEMDVEDVHVAEAIVFFGEASGSLNRGGGRWFELGVAWERGKLCFAVLGHSGMGEHAVSKEGHESVFTHLPNIKCCSSKEELLEILAGMS